MTKQFTVSVFFTQTDYIDVERTADQLQKWGDDSLMAGRYWQVQDDTGEDCIYRSISAQELTRYTDQEMSDRKFDMALEAWLKRRELED
jgi:hypothetical protein